MSEMAVVLRDVKKRFGHFTLDIPELSLERGYVLGLVGPNGAGKSTLLNIIMNLIYPDSGSVEVLGLRQPADSIAIKRRIGYLSESPAFYGEMSVGWTAGLVRSYFPDWDDALYRSYLDRFSLDPQMKTRRLSKGNTVKLALTLALSHRPDLLILDEPTSGIDPVMRQDLLQEIAGVIRDERRSVIFSSHITQDVEQVADYVGILGGGRILEHDDVPSLGERWKQISGTLPGGAPASFVSLRADGDSFVGVTRQYSPELLQRLASAGAGNLRVKNVGLDTILVSLVSGEARRVDGGERRE